MIAYPELGKKLEELLQTNSKGLSSILKEITSILQQASEKYTWVGFYFMNHQSSMLYLGPYSGAETEHTIIPFGKGICGQVAVSGNTYIAEDVNSESNYIACSADVRSEIVVPIYYQNNLLAQLDIDSRLIDAFDEQDQEFLENLCRQIGEAFGEKLSYEKFFS